MTRKLNRAIITCFILNLLMSSHAKCEEQNISDNSRIAQVHSVDPMFKKTAFGLGFYEETLLAKTAQRFSSSKFGLVASINQHLRYFFDGELMLKSSIWRFKTPDKEGEGSTAPLIFPLQLSSQIKISPPLPALFGISFDEILKISAYGGIGYIWCPVARSNTKSTINFVKSELTLNWGADIKWIWNSRFALQLGLNFMEGAETSQFDIRSMTVEFQFGDF